MNIKIRSILILLVAAIASCSRYPSGPLVFVSNERGGTISVIDGAKDKIVDTIIVGGRPRGVRLSADGKRLYVAVSTRINAKPVASDFKIVVIDATTGKEIKIIPAGTDPEQLAVNADQTRMYVSKE